MVWALGVASAQAITLQPLGVFDQPTFVTSDPANPDRLFVTEQRGRIRLLQADSASTYADLTTAVGCGANCSGERGLMSMAFAPDFARSGRLYVDYVDDVDGTIHVDELIASGGSASFSRSILTIPHPDDNNHNGGQLQFGPDGYLYISTGDGGGSDGQYHYSQDPSSLLGKILRVDPSQARPTPEVWNLGLRNPFRFSFDRLTGGMVIGDVGQGEREEVDWAPSTAPGVIGGLGANYGWNCREGLIAGPATDPECSVLLLGDFVDPVFDYPHSDPGGGRAYGCSIIGGYVASDPGLGALNGRYVYSDYCTGEIRSLLLPATALGTASGDRSEGLAVTKPVSFGEDSCGRLYVVAQAGQVSRVEGATPTDCGTSSENVQNLHVGIKAERRRVRRGKPALITAWVSPCEGHRGATVRLLRGGRRNGSKFLSRACTVRFHPRVRHRTMFKAELVPSESDPRTAESRRLTIKIDHRRRR